MKESTLFLEIKLYTLKKLRKRKKNVHKTSIFYIYTYKYSVLQQKATAFTLYYYVKTHFTVLYCVILCLTSIWLVNNYGELSQIQLLSPAKDVINNTIIHNYILAFTSGSAHVSVEHLTVCYLIIDDNLYFI